LIVSLFAFSKNVGLKRTRAAPKSSISITNASTVEETLSNLTQPLQQLHTPAFNPKHNF